MKRHSVAALLALAMLARAGAADAMHRRPGANAAAGVPGPAESARTAQIENLYGEARQALTALPPWLAPRLLSLIGNDERRLDPAQARRDLRAAYIAALNLPEAVGRGGAAEQVKIKREAETNAVSAFAFGGDFAAALALARQADVLKAPLYDELILAVEQGRRAGGLTTQIDGRGPLRGCTAPPAYARAPAVERERRWDARPCGMSRPFAPALPTGQTALPLRGDPKSGRSAFNLVQECERADGSFPYRGAAVLLRRRNGSGLDANSRLELAQEGLQRAAAATDPGQRRDALFFMRAAHTRFPELDPEIETTLIAALRRLRSSDEAVATGAGTAPWVKGQMLALLKQLDPERGSAWTTRLERSAWPPVARPRLDVAPALSFSADAAGAATAGSAGMPVGAEELQNLVSQAERLQRHDLGQALSLADRAAGMLSHQLADTSAPVVARLAALEAHLGASADAARLLARALEAADRQARELDSVELAPGADAAAVVAAAQGYDPVAAAVMDVYSIAARIDPQTAAAKAEQSEMILLKPLILSRIALIQELRRQLPVLR